MSADHKMADGTERLAKRVAVQQSCSRADAERYIEGGWIAVDGQVVEEPGFRVGASQTVSLLPGARLETLRPVTILVHKPVGVYANDEPGLGPRPDRARQPHGGRPLAAALPQAPAGRIAIGDAAGARRQWPGGLHAGISGGTQAAGSPSGRTGIHCRGQRQPGRGRTRLAAPGLPYDGLPASPMQVSWQNETRLRFALKTPAPGFIDTPATPPDWNCGPCAASASAACRSPAARRPMARAPGLRALLRPTRSAEQPTYSRSTPDRCRTIPSRQRAEVFSNRPACSDWPR